MNAALKALSALLTYPTAELQEAAADIGFALAHNEHLRGNVWTQVSKLASELAIQDLYDLQERYVLLFDRTRSLSLHLFEHVHGESRDRGQAMIDLKSQYAAHGLEMSANELPDFLPLFLEYVSLLPPKEARDALRQPAHILTALAERLAKRGSAYEAIFCALVAIADAKPGADDVSALLQTPDHDASDLSALDEAWEDTAVSFGPDSACKDGIVARVRGAMRPAPGLSIPSR